VTQLHELASGARRGAVADTGRAFGEISLAVAETFNPSGNAELYDMTQVSPHSSMNLVKRSTRNSIREFIGVS
jgi:hypothetical protein